MVTIVTSTEPADEPFRLDEAAISVPQCRSDLLTRDDRAFDFEIVRGAVVLYNLRHAGPQGIMARAPSVDETLAVVDQAFGWVPEVIQKRAQAAGFEAAVFRWSPPTVADLVASCKVLIVSIGEFRTLAGPLTYARRNLTADQWLDDILSALPILSRYRNGEGKMRLSTVPVLSGVQQCVAYALAVIQLDRWKLAIADRIRECPYIQPKFGDRQNSHFFLDFRLSDEGELEKNRQRFCCPEHANRYKQSKHRQKAAAPTRKHK